MTPAPYRKAFKMDAAMTPAWFATPEARRLVDNMLSYQTPSGGWSKHVEFSLHPRGPGESFYSENDAWHYIATIDNDSTTEELRVLDAAFSVTGDPKLRAGFDKGIDYLLAAQFPNGCWPQVYPLQGGYHDAITYNDDAVVNVLRVLDEVASGGLPAASAGAKKRAIGALARGVDCIVASQVVDRGVRTVWAQQQDPLSYAPVIGRSYELAGLAGRESARLMMFLMARHTPSPAVVGAVHAAAAWFRAHVITGMAYDKQTGPRPDVNAPPIWARLYELGTGRPMFSNRDGVPRYDWSELGDRRFGYAWYSKEPAEALAAYERWAAQHPGAPRR
jgi:PelA/Pel-15E family pectate lyase